MPFATNAQGYSTSGLAQIRKHIGAVVIVPHARAVECIQVRGSKRGSSDWQCNRHIQPLLASQANTAFTGLIRVFITKTAAAFHTCAQ